MDNANEHLSVFLSNLGTIEHDTPINDREADESIDIRLIGLRLEVRSWKLVVQIIHGVSLYSYQRVSDLLIWVLYML